MKPIEADVLCQLFEAVDVRIWQYDATTNNICYMQADGTPEESVPFERHMAMKHPDDRPQVFESMEYMMAHKKAWPHTMLLRYMDDTQPDGWRYTLNALVPKFDEDGNIASVVGTEQDITSMVRKQLLAEEQTELIGKMLRTRNDDTWTVDRQTEILTIRRKDDTVEQMTMAEFQKTIDMEEGTEAANMVKAFYRGDAKILNFNLTQRDEQGNVRCYKSCTAMPSKYDYRGNVTEYMGVTTDVTKETVAKHDLEQQLAEAEEQSKKKSVFVARASHDLRNPLNVLLSLSEMMCMDDDMPMEERQELCEMMKQSGDALQNLINDILDLSRIESGTMQLTKEEFNIMQLVGQAITSFEIQTNKSHKITLHADVENPVVTSDSKRLTQIVNNYLSNAIKYSPAGSSIAVTVKNSDAGGLCIAVKDSGCGISESDQARVFDEFARFNTEVTGTGLGLSICKRIAESLGGSVGFESELGKGSTFWVKI